MNRNEFEALRSLEGKIITEDITFIKQKPTDFLYTFSGILVSNDMGLTIYLNGHYDPRIPKYGFNFTLHGTGPICRLDVNGTVHGKAGRTHKHELLRETDPMPGSNLPHAIRRDDFGGVSVEEAWRQLCLEAKIQHSGAFNVPN